VTSPPHETPHEERGTSVAPRSVGPVTTTPILRTQRLHLREFGEDDLDSLAAMVADEEQMKFYPRVRTRADASAWISRNLDFYRDCGFGFWLIESQSTSAFLGYCGIRPLWLEGASEIEIGWHIDKSSWNQGIATEAASAARHAAAGRFGFSRLVALIHPEHLASRRVAEKIRMRAEKTIVFEDCPTTIYTTELP
jgi:RimJ/RimL family protein N-acetyltransferase